MQYKEHQFQYESEFPDTDQEQSASDRKQYRRGRPFRNARRRTAKKPTSSPGPGIGARRNRRWSW
jgi:hypothetical protein